MQGTGGAEAGTGGVRGYAATSAQERLDAEVAAGGVMDEGARVEQQREEALAERNASRRLAPLADPCHRDAASATKLQPLHPKP